VRVAAIIQARRGSKRLPGKVLMDIGGRPMIWHVVKRALDIHVPVIVAAPEADAFEIAPLIEKLDGHKVMAPLSVKDDDVLGRYYLASRGYDAIMRITGDCPLIDPALCRDTLSVFIKGSYDWVALTNVPDGLGCDVFSFGALERAHQLYGDLKRKDYAPKREHVSPAIIADKRNVGRNYNCPVNSFCDVKLSVDTQEDLDLVRAIDAAQPKDYSLQSTLEALRRAQNQDHA
jgi:spore coat polysaccharide biosynthesis protein SpsF (cytidylyltransferase family)